MSYRYEWQCLECGDHGIKANGFPTLDERCWASIRATHNRANPGCDGGDDALRARQMGESEGVRFGGETGTPFTSAPAPAPQEGAE